MGFFQCKVPPQPVGEEYTEIEKCFPYDPSGESVCSFVFFPLWPLTEPPPQLSVSVL